MAKSNRTLTHPIEQKQKDLHKLILTKGDKDKIKELQSYIDYVHWGITYL